MVAKGKAESYGILFLPFYYAAGSMHLVHSFNNKETPLTHCTSNPYKDSNDRRIHTKILIQFKKLQKFKLFFFLYNFFI